MIFSTHVSKVMKMLKKTDMFLPWATVVDRIGNRSGSTLIVEQAQKEGILLWWTADAIPHVCPFEIAQPDSLDYLRIDTPRTCLCFDRQPMT